MMGGVTILKKSEQNAAEGWRWGAPLSHEMATFFQNLETSHAFVKVFRAHKADSEPTPAAAKAAGRLWDGKNPWNFQPEIHMEGPISCTPHTVLTDSVKIGKNVAKCENPETSVSSRREANFRNWDSVFSWVF